MGIKKGQVYEGTVIDYKFPNKGKVQVEGQNVFVKGALPGQKVSFTISRKRSNGSEGKLVEVLERSPIEDGKALCSHFGQCGGCMYQNLSYENQLQLKAGMVKKLLGGVYPDFEFEGITGSPEICGYRNKMEFTFGDECKDGPFAIGLHRKESFHDIVNLNDCALVHPDFNTIRNAVRDYLNIYYVAGKVDFNHQLSHRGYLRHLLIRRSVFNQEIIVALITTTPDNCDKLDPAQESEIIEGYKNTVLKLQEEGKLQGKVTGICHVYNNALSDIVRNDDMHILYGRDYITESILGLEFKISLFSFFQTNSKGCEKLYEKAREFAAYTGGGVVYDLYSGTGTIAQLMSPAASKVIGVEIVEDAVESARNNAKLNNIDNVEFIAGDVMKVLCGEIGENLPRPDMIILDPPREGIHPKALGRILGFGVDRIVYISCKPTSLAADLVSFKEAGYKLEKAACVDMFPHTAHVETVVLMSRRDK